ncbi:50S ribosomal protein L25/general stress protein Ctc [Streptomyces olivoreticuli]|uniref:50S ribosomal protein L25/general stress protein Ctc n=1 Tax=Streptomyces olivoreticuli TaxID=68246 RepID=UPI0026581AE9|nr:50S ribosomal protein L25/general stress protein Ctc [Streptomyces olivoreticuli]WKK21479.1 50S ribosomal protein L25/general stress protein Ctc [Streptomyces olivoreticuli]
MSEVKIPAQIRREFGKGFARRARVAGQVPAVVYGHGGEPVHVTLPGHDMMMALKTPNVLLSLDIEGRTELVIPKAVQRDALKGFLVHVDLLVVAKGEKVTVEVPVQTQGELAPGGNLLEHILNTLTVEAEATHLPEAVVANIAGLSAGASVLAKDVVLPAGTTLAVDGDTVVLQVMGAQTEAPAEAEGTEA